MTRRQPAHADQRARRERHLVRSLQATTTRRTGRRVTHTEALNSATLAIELARGIPTPLGPPDPDTLAAAHTEAEHLRATLPADLLAAIDTDHRLTDIAADPDHPYTRLAVAAIRADGRHVTPTLVLDPDTDRPLGLVPAAGPPVAPPADRLDAAEAPT